MQRAHLLMHHIDSATLRAGRDPLLRREPKRKRGHVLWSCLILLSCLGLTLIEVVK